MPGWHGTDLSDGINSLTEVFFFCPSMSLYQVKHSDHIQYSFVVTNDNFLCKIRFKNRNLTVSQPSFFTVSTIFQQITSLQGAQSSFNFKFVTTCSFLTYLLLSNLDINFYIKCINWNTFIAWMQPNICM